MDIEKFADGTSIEWFSRESLMYRDGSYVVQVEYDYYETGSSKMGRKIFCDTIEFWEEYPEGSSPEISRETRQEITEKAVAYFENRNIEVQVINT